MTEDYISHYGVLGMKWGVRKDNYTSGYIPKGKSKGARANRLADEFRAYKKLNPANKDAINSDDVQKMLARQELARKIIKGAALVGVGSLVAYTAYTVYKTNNGVNLPAGTLLQHVTAIPAADFSLDRRLFTSHEARDMAVYRDKMRSFLRAAYQQPNADVFKITLKTTENIKAPSHKQARKLFEEFLSSSDADVASPYYKDFMQQLIQTTDTNLEFFDFVKSKGYNALIDYNDQYISGFGARKPLIIFNANSSTTQLGRSLITDQIQAQSARDSINKVGVGTYKAATYGASTLAVGSALTMKNKRLQTRVDKYRKEHPESSMTDLEIAVMLKDKK